MAKVVQQRRETNEVKQARKQMLAKLAESCLDAKDAAALDIRPVSKADSVSLGLSRAGAGFKLSYFDIQGKQLPMFRYRYFETSGAFGVKVNKYSQPTGTAPEIYLPRIGEANWQEIASDASHPIAIIEGELKAASLTKHGVPTIGLGGIFNFARKKHGVEFLPSLEIFNWVGREVHIVTDSDIATNIEIRRAANRLAKLLTERGATVRIVEVPVEGNAKVGADDFIHAHGIEKFKKLMENAPLWENMRGLHELSEQISYVKSPSCIAVLSKDENSDVELLTVRVARDERFANLFYRDELGKLKPAFPHWFKHMRVDVAGIDYDPAQPRITDDNKLNLYRGMGCKPCKGDVTLFLELMAYLFPDPVQREWLLCWIAYPLQHPGTKLYTAVVLFSRFQGVGKSLLGMILRKIYGAHNCSIIDQSALESSFTGWSKGKLMVFGEEITGGSGRQQADRLKNMVTGHTISTNVKYQPELELPNLINFFLTTNHPDAFHMEGGGDRRYAVFEIESKPQPPDWYQRYDKWVHAKGDEDTLTPAVYQYLLDKGLGTFNPRGHAIETRAKHRMIEASRSQVEQWCVDLLEQPDSVLRFGDVKIHGSLFTTERLLQIYSHGERTSLSAKGMAAALRKAGFSQIANGEAVDIPCSSQNAPRRVRLWIVRGHDSLSQLKVSELAKIYAQQEGLLKKGKTAKMTPPKVGKADGAKLVIQ